MRQTVACIGLIIISLVNTLHAAPDQREAQAREIAEMLAHGRSSRVDEAIEQISTMLESDPGRAVSYLRRFWVKPMLDNHMEDIVIKVTFQAILAVPSQTGDLEYLLETRIRALLRDGQNDEALMNAKSLFNVSSLRNTNKALLLLDECLRQSRPGKPQLYKQLHQEQIQGAVTIPEKTPNPVECTVIREIRVNADVYKWRIGLITSNDDRSQLAKGNLLLLADQPKDAHAVFEQLLASTEAVKLLPFYEHVARAVKAEDGTIGRANDVAINAPDDD